MASSSRGGGNWCAAPNCQNTRKKGWRLFSFPKDEERCKRWVLNCRRKDLMNKPASYLYANCCLCSDHFEASQFMNPSNKNCRLIWCAIPTLFNIPNPPQTLAIKRAMPTRHALPAKIPRKQKGTVADDKGFTLANMLQSAVTDPPATDPMSDLSSLPVPQASSPGPPSPVPEPSAVKELSPNKRALKKKVKSLQQKCRRFKGKTLSRKDKPENKKKIIESIESKKRRLLEELKEYLPPSTMNFVATQIRLSGKKKKGNRWTPAEKSLALSLLHTSPKAYRMLQKLLQLPSVATLRRAMQKVKIFPGFNDNILQALRRKVSALPPGGKVCAIVFDEMTVKEELSYNIEEDIVEGLEDFGNQRSNHVANHATVFMVRGLLEPWKQAVGYFLSSGPVSGNLLKSLLTQCIERLTEIGLNVKAVICDQGSNNRKAIQGLGVTADRTYFMHQETRIYVIYDPPHLLKNVRNNLKKTGFQKNGNRIAWTYIEEFFLLDSKNSVRMAPKLTHKHIRLPSFSALKVKLATQVLSHSVAAGLSTMVTLGALPLEAKETALFLERMDQLFNACNSSRKFSNQKMRHAISEVSGHKDFFKDTLIWLSTLQSNSTRPLPCMIGWRMTIQSLLLLWEDLREIYQVGFLYTSRLNQDCLENLFSVIRGKGGHGDNPSPKQFRLFLRQAMVDSILLQSTASNCKEDGDNFLLTLNNMSAQRLNTIPFNDLPETRKQHQNYDASLMALALSIPALELSLQEENTLMYIAGYIARKIRDKVCEQCAEVLEGVLEGTQKETLLTMKQLPNLQGHGLVIPSTNLVTVVEEMENVFKKSEQLLHMDTVRTRFLKKLDKEVRSSLMCPIGLCQLKKLVISLYFNIRIHFILKDNNRQFAATSGRQNRKMLKLQHL